MGGGKSRGLGRADGSPAGHRYVTARQRGRLSARVACTRPRLERTHQREVRSMTRTFGRGVLAFAAIAFCFSLVASSALAFTPMTPAGWQVHPYGAEIAV